MSYLMSVFWFILPIIPSLYALIDSQASTGLCKPLAYVKSADVLANGSIRLYKEKNWWELSGNPMKAYISMNGTIDLENMKELKRGDIISTAVYGRLKGRTFRFNKNRVWSWDGSGKLLTTDRSGDVISGAPLDGFATVFHNRDQNKPMFIGLTTITAYFMSTNDMKLSVGSNTSMQNYPSGTDTAFVWVKVDGKRDIVAFMNGKYCIQGLDYTEMRKESCSGDVDEWGENTELFGCLSDNSRTTKTTITTKTTKRESSVTGINQEIPPIKEAIVQNNTSTESTSIETPEVTKSETTSTEGQAKEGNTNQAIDATLSSVLFFIVIAFRQLVF